MACLKGCGKRCYDIYVLGWTNESLTQERVFIFEGKMSENKTNTIGKMFTMPELMKFVAAPVVSKLFMSLLSTIDDSLFISRYCGQNALAAFTIAMPWFMIVDAIVMVICAVSSKCSMLMGEKKNDEANSSFTTMVLVSLGVGMVLTIILSLFKIPILRFLGATDELLPYISSFMNVSRFYIPLIIATNLFGRFYVIAGKPKMSIITSMVQIACNLFFDWLLIAKMNIGIVGAAYGNLAGLVLLAIIGLVFYSNKDRELHFAKPLDDPRDLYSSVWKLGRSQGLTSVAISLNTYLTNAILLKSGGETLVAGFTVVSNVQFMFMNAFFGFIGSVSPIASYAYGEGNPKKLSNICKKATILIEGLSLFVSLFIVVFKNPILYLYFPGPDTAIVKQMAYTGLNVTPFVYFIFSFNVLVQELLIAVGNHKTSTILSILENIVFGNLSVLILPLLFGQDGIWFMFIAGEFVTFIVTLYVVYINRDVYGYGKDGIATFMSSKF